MKITNYGLFIIPLNIAYRAYLLLRFLALYSIKGIKWFMASNEHTNFSFNITDDNVDNINYILSNLTCIDEKEYKDTLVEFRKIKLEKNDFIKMKHSTRFDIDFVAKWDYRYLIYALLRNNDFKNIYEFGFDQGRIPFLVNHLNTNCLCKKANRVNYFGIDHNRRKGALASNSSKDNINLYFESVQNYLSSNSNIDLSNRTLLVSTTHESESEQALFRFLQETNTTPKMIISDMTDRQSAYTKFTNNYGYTSTKLLFIDRNGFINPLSIGIASI